MKTRLLLIGLFLTSSLIAEPGRGPVLEHYGPVIDVPESRFNLSADKRYQVVFDVSTSASDRSKVNGQIETVARFLNMHARTGVAPEQLDIAVVFHGKSTFDALSDAAHQERFEQANPNTRLLKELKQAGVSFYLCGQSAGFSQVAVGDLAEPVELALSAMTVLVELQSRGYSLIAF